MRIYNSLSKRVEEFKPLNLPKVTFYGCGPTVYDHIHLGNCRSFIMYDILHRVLMANGYEVTFIQNITDVEDKIIKRAHETGDTVQELTDKYTKIFFEDIAKLNILPANNYPKATEHVGKMVKFVEELIDKGLAYLEKDGSVYFDVSKFTGYGKLSGVDRSQIKAGTRVLSDEYSKDSVQDFALWKSVDPADSTSWNSPWGKGRPGWHLECSVMSTEYLGETIDLHTGGVDLLFPHHENEIAQSEGVSGQPFVLYWVHGEHLLVNGAKMSKSLNNFYTLKDITDRQCDPLAYRYLVLTAHYRDKLNFTWESLEAANKALENLRGVIREVRGMGEVSAEYWERFLEAVNSDLGTPQGLAVLWELVKSDLPEGQKAATILKIDAVLGLKLDEYLGKRLEVPAEVMKLVNQREEARKSGDFKKSDDLRNKIKDLGYLVEDSEGGPRVKKS